jgi:SAM-dependent methyltransferase
MATDKRAEIYDDLHHRQLAQQEAQNRESALTILGIVNEYLKPQSVLDIGCGLGTWLAVARELGAGNVHGVDGNWLDRSKLAIDSSLVTLCDLENGISLDRRFDLAICLEVGEHLFERAAPTLVASLTKHSDLVLFSAAIPFQGGHHHVNERFLDYWESLFAAQGFRALDFIRPRIWTDSRILWWLRQNVVVFAHDRLLAANEKLRQEQTIARPLSIVHPDVYLSRLREAQRIAEEHQKLVTHLGQGGTFSVTRLQDGRLNINKVN